MRDHDPHLLELSGDLVVHAARLFRAARRISADSPSTGMRILSLLDEVGPATVTRLAALDRCSQATMSGGVTDLVDRGWATKVPHPDDARSSLVAPTPAGDLALAEVRRQHAEAVAARFTERGNHSVDDVATAVAVLRDLLPTDTAAPRGLEGNL